MSLNLSSVENARTSLEIIIANLESIKSNSESFLKLFNEANFQRFLNETTKGQIIEKQVESLKSFIDSSSTSIKDLEAKTEVYLNTQELLNK